MKRQLLSFACLAAITFTACGPEEGQTRIALRPVQMMCKVPALQARLEVAGGIVCPLDVAEDNSVTGVCPAIPTGDVVQFRLVYFVAVLLGSDPIEIQLASALTQVDLQNYGEDTVQLNFTAGNLKINFDDDGDGMSNLLEICNNTNPLPD